MKLSKLLLQAKTQGFSLFQRVFYYAYIPIILFLGTDCSFNIRISNSRSRHGVPFYGQETMRLNQLLGIQFETFK
jgi:hypothetical protein